ncbi:replication-associated recombination protein A [Cytophagaceae bacterium DM2B3-1]|uniref:Replication-associated recombination protein A n=1 Tax=Xanthocytophaga flava TaxID=3048013 RepID=A0ABT7D252_9BACT|nr:replication-associated recombination protein A [Xanthocytophaga flavus]MDJ1471438.1 replication-associated recombination protein A [Xanthocytophaga flavus]MDJ1498864.1 replication-associated recombination protein A [Xanthocytophaga flavus]
MSSQPLAERIRPKKLDEVIGQPHLVGENSVLRRVLASGHIPSMILWGPPGVGKTTLATLIAHEAGLPFFTLSAISSGVKEVREVIELAKAHGKAILFIDEIHRFNKSQQDALLGAVERGTITLIGATTENPSFEVNSALLSRSQVYILKALTPEDLIQLIHIALKKDKLLAEKTVEVRETEALLNISGGDARKLLNLLELVINAFPVGQDIVITDDKVMEIAQRRVALYDKGGEQHYDIISAFIKSIRGSDPNAAVYWLARMLAGGEDIKFIARRLVILASEDIGNANPNALLLATSCMQAVQMVGMPESEIILSQCVVFLATSVKSNSSYVAIKKANELIRMKGDLPVPLHIRNAPTKLMKQQGYGQNYQYAHDYEGNFVNQEFLPADISGSKLYDPGNNTRENELRKQLKNQWGSKYNY